MPTSISTDLYYFSSRYFTAYSNRTYTMSPPTRLLTNLQNGGKFCLTVLMDGPWL